VELEESNSHGSEIFGIEPA